MRRAAVLLAAAIVLVSNVWIVVSAGRNRSDTPGGTVELTERELGLPPRFGDSTALWLELRWEVSGTASEDERAPDWLSPAKLEELGFDCRVSAKSPSARDHYAAQSPAMVYLALEYEGEAWKAAERQRAGHRAHGPPTRLFVVDVGRDARELRAKHPDGARLIITHGIVRPFVQDRNLSDGTPLPEPRLRGRVLGVIPDQICVPLPFSRALQDLRGGEDRAREDPAAEPRFAVTVSWGARYEPWAQSVRLLPAAGG